LALAPGTRLVYEITAQIGGGVDAQFLLFHVTDVEEHLARESTQRPVDLVR
jgi:hypothetical protein